MLLDNYNGTYTIETRREAYLTRPINPRSRQILYTLGNRTMTARQLAYEMGFSDLNAVKPRLTEMQEQGRIKAVGKTTDTLTGRTVAVWRKA